MNKVDLGATLVNDLKGKTLSSYLIYSLYNYQD